MGMKTGFVSRAETDPMQGTGVSRMERNEGDEPDPGGVPQIALGHGAGIPFGGVDVGEEGFEIDDEVAGGRTGATGLTALVASGEGDEDG